MLDATHSRSAADFEQAKGYVIKLNRPYFDRILNDAFEGGRDFCDLPDYVDEEEEQACNANWNARRIVAYGTDRARLALLRDNDLYPAENILELYRRTDKGSGIWSYHYSTIHPGIFDLYLGIAEASYRKASEPKDVYRLAGALEDFVEATRQVDPALDPVAYRQSATRTLEVAAEIEELERARDRHGLTLHLTGSLAWIRLTLANLRQIAEARIE